MHCFVFSSFGGYSVNRMKKIVSFALVVMLLGQLLVITASARIPIRKPEIHDQPDASGLDISAQEVVPAATEATESEEGRILALPDSVPQYFMNGYTDQRYADGIVATHGSSITSLAMVATYLTGHTYTPDVLADYFGGYPGSYYEKLENAANQLQLPCPWALPQPFRR